MGAFRFWAHRRGIRTRKGAELRKRVSVFQRSTRGAKRRSGSGRRSRTRTSLIAHHLNDKASSNGGLSFWAHRRGIRTRKGAELRKRVSVFQRSTRGAKRRSGSGRRSRTRTSLIAHHLNDKASSNGGLSFWAPRRGIRTRQDAELRKRASVFQRSTQGAKRRSGSGRRNASLANAPVQNMPNMSTATILVAGFSRPQRANRTLKRRPTVQMGSISDCNTGHLWFN